MLSHRFAKQFSVNVSLRSISSVKNISSITLSRLSQTRHISPARYTTSKIKHTNVNIAAISATRNMSSTTSGLPPLKNELHKAKSPYLLQHKDNPVAWQEWKPETIARAQKEDKLIFLSVGYSACHWCHVLAAESFADPMTAEIMNKYFVNIKVDREERPDVDRMYMTFLQATQGGGGWPLSVWLTPTLEPIFAGTYFPRGQFISVMDKLNNLWTDDRERLLASGKDILKQLKEINATEPSAMTTPIPQLVQVAAPRVFSHLSRGYDPKYGGFSKLGPKFPSPSQTLVFLSRFATYFKNIDEGKNAAEMGYRMIRALWEGGIRDWVGSGLARYSVDAKWRVPHFEKMLYDQAQVASSALDFATLSCLSEDEKKVCLDLAADILEYSARDLQSKTGGFYSAEDADSSESFDHLEKHSEGAFYIWSENEFKQVVGPEDAEIAATFWNITEQNIDPSTDAHGEMTGKNTLYQAMAWEEVAQKHNVSLDRVHEAINHAIARLRAHRDKTRPRPHLDDKILTSWNGLMLSTLAQAACILPPDRYPIAKECLSMAERSVAFIRSELYDETMGLSRSWREGKGPIGQADDYAFLIRGLIDLYQACGKEEYLVFAITLQNKMDQLFWDDEDGGYFASAPDPSILIRLKDSQDGAEPAASSIAVHNLQRLALLASNSYDIFKSKAEKTYASNEAMLKRAPHAFATTVAALMDMDKGYKEYIIVGSSDDPFVNQLRQHIFSTYIPNKVILYIDPSNPPDELARYNPIISDLIKGMKSDERPSVRLCENFTCNLPVYELEEAKRMVFGK